jgi:RHS repeat-associated protein
VAITDASGNVIERTVYEPYGAVVNRPLKDGPGYTGHVTDSGTGLSYMQQRYYDPGLGNFLSVDPVAASQGSIGQFGRYRYGEDNPYRFTDPDGRQVSDPRSCHDTSSCLTLDQAQQQIGRDGRLMLRIVGGSAAAGATGGAAAEGGGFVSALVAAMRGTITAGKDFSQAQKYIDSIADQLGPTGGRAGRRTSQYEGHGGDAGAKKMFNVLTRGKSEARDGGQLGKLGDGSVVQMSARITRDGSGETSVRLSTERTGTKIKEVIKVRFKEE